MNHFWVVELNLGSRCPDQVLEAARGSHRSVLISDFSWCSFFFKKCLVTWELWSHSILESGGSMHLRSKNSSAVVPGVPGLWWWLDEFHDCFCKHPNFPDWKLWWRKISYLQWIAEALWDCCGKANQGWEETPSRCFAGQQPRSPLCDETSRSSWKWGPT